MKTCGKCKQEKTFVCFSVRRASRDGLAHKCKPCDDASRKARKAADPEKERAIQASWKARNSDRKKATDRRIYLENKPARNKAASAYYAINKERHAALAKLWREANAETLRQHKLEYRAKNAERVLAGKREHYRKNKAVYIANVGRRNAAKIKATPLWADIAQINAIYIERERITAETGILHHVDHIIPLRSKWVSGLHVHYNLQVIPATVNLSKSNRLQIEV